MFVNREPTAPYALAHMKTLTRAQNDMMDSMVEGSIEVRMSFKDMLDRASGMCVYKECSILNIHHTQHPTRLT